MGMQDKNSQAQREREKQLQIDKTRSKFALFSRNHLSAKVLSPTKIGLVPMLIFWFVVMGLLYMGRINGREARFMVDKGGHAGKRE